MGAGASRSTAIDWITAGYGCNSAKSRLRTRAGGAPLVARFDPPVRIGRPRPSHRAAVGPLAEVDDVNLTVTKPSFATDFVPPC
jgi:hypothetical protein